MLALLSRSVFSLSHYTYRLQGRSTLCCCKSMCCWFKHHSFWKNLGASNNFPRPCYLCWFNLNLLVLALAHFVSLPVSLSLFFFLFRCFLSFRLFLLPFPRLRPFSVSGSSSRGWTSAASARRRRCAGGLPVGSTQEHPVDAQQRAAAPCSLPRLPRRRETWRGSQKRYGPDQQRKFKQW